AVDGKLDLDQVATLERVTVGQGLTAIMLDPLAGGLAATASGSLHRVIADEPGHFAIDLDLQPGARDRVLEREVAQVRVPVERSLPFFPDAQSVRAGIDLVALEDQSIVEAEEIFRRDAHLLPRLTVQRDRDGQVGPILTTGLEVIGQ